MEFTYEEALGMADARGLPYEEFMRRYAIRRGPTWILRETPAPDGEGYDCVLLERDGESGLTRCSVHKARPMQCRTWPFWPENLQSARTWRRAGRECEGIDRGQTVGFREICHNRDLTPEQGVPFLGPDV